jgi:hypothetical protein
MDYGNKQRKAADLFRLSENGRGRTPSGFQLFFPSGYGASIQWGTGHYASNNAVERAKSLPDGVASTCTKPAREATTAEMAVIRPDGSLMPLGIDTVVGDVSPAAVAHVLAMLADGPGPMTVDQWAECLRHAATEGE